MTAQQLLEELLKIPEEKRAITNIDMWNDYYECPQETHNLMEDGDYPDVYIIC